MAHSNNMTQDTIANLSLACHYWEMAKAQMGSKASAAYYNKAYTLLRREMGAESPITLELRREMAR